MSHPTHYFEEICPRNPTKVSMRFIALKLILEYTKKNSIQPAVTYLRDSTGQTILSLKVVPLPWDCSTDRADRAGSGILECVVFVGAARHQQ